MSFGARVYVVCAAWIRPADNDNNDVRRCRHYWAFSYFRQNSQVNGQRDNYRCPRAFQESGISCIFKAHRALAIEGGSERERDAKGVFSRIYPISSIFSLSLSISNNN